MLLEWWELGAYLQFAAETKDPAAHWAGFKQRSKRIVPRRLTGDFVLGLNVRWGVGSQEGSIELWFRAAQCGQRLGSTLFGRDAFGTERNGHVRLSWDRRCTLAVRFQRIADEVTLTSNVLPTGRWIHVAINFGAPAVESHVDRVLVQSGAGDWNIAGNANPWVIGASNHESPEGTADPSPTYPVSHMAIDEFRLSRVRRSFAP